MGPRPLGARRGPEGCARLGAGAVRFWAPQVSARMSVARPPGAVWGASPLVGRPRRRSIERCGGELKEKRCGVEASLSSMAMGVSCFWRWTCLLIVLGREWSRMRKCAHRAAHMRHPSLAPLVRPELRATDLRCQPRTSGHRRRGPCPRRWRRPQGRRPQHSDSGGVCAEVGGCGGGRRGVGGGLGGGGRRRVESGG